MYHTNRLVFFEGPNISLDCILNLLGRKIQSTQSLPNNYFCVKFVLTFIMKDYVNDIYRKVSLA